MFVYISTGNSDDKLSQRQWAHLLFEVNKLLEHFTVEGTIIVHGRWYSSPVTEWQNACFCIELLDTSTAQPLKDALKGIASEFNQDSIAWAETPETEFLKGTE